MKNLRGLLGIRITPNAWVREQCRVMKVFYDGLATLKKMGRDRIAKRVYVGECAGSC